MDLLKTEISKINIFITMTDISTYWNWKMENTTLISHDKRTYGLSNT